MHYTRLLLLLLLFSSAYAKDDAYCDFLSIGAGLGVQRGVHSLPLDKPLGFEATFQTPVKQAIASFGYRREPSEGFYSYINLVYLGYSSQDVQVTPSVKLDQSEFFYNIKALFGYTMDVGLSFKVTPCLGLGTSNTRLKYHFSSLLPTTKAFLSRKWSCYIVGIHLDGSFTNKLHWAVYLHVKPNLLAPKLRSNIVGVEDLKLLRKVNYALELPISYQLNAGKDRIRLSPFYESANFGSIKGGDSMEESAYKSYFLGARLEYLFGF